MSLRAVASGGGGGGGGTGDVVGPASSTLNAIARYADTTGKLLKDSSGATVSDSFAMTLASGTITTSQPILNLSQTWNDAGVTFYGITADFTTTAAAAASRLMRLRTSGTTVFEVGPVGSVTLSGSINMGAGSTNPQAILNGGTVTTSTPVLSVSQTWNAAATFVGAVVNITNTSSDAASSLLVTQVGGSARSLDVKVGTASRVLTLDGSLTSTGTYAASSYEFQIRSSTAVVMTAVVGFGLRLGNAHNLGWTTSAAAAGSTDITLNRDASGILAQRNATTAQVYRVYRTYTDASNYERLALQSGAGYFEVASETAGTGTDDIDLRLTPSTTTAAVDFRNPANGAGAGAGTITNAPSAGNPAYWLKIKIAGTVHYIPAWT